MATTFTVAGVDLGRSGLQKWSEDGNRVRINGTIRETTAAGFSVALAQVRGILNDPDQISGIPVIPSADSSLAGFYRVTGGGVDVTPESYRSFWANYSLELERVPGFVSPLVESRLLGGLRTNDHSIVVGDTSPWWATPTDAEQDNQGVSTAARAGDGGSVAFQYTSAGTVLYDRTASMRLAAGDWYDMAATIEVTDGVTWRKLVGRETGATPTTGWRLNNGLTRVSYGGGNGLLSVEHHNGTSWGTAKIYKVGVESTGVLTAFNVPFTSLTVLRNAPEAVAIRLGTGTGAAYTVIDINLRRGAYMADCAVIYSSAGYFGVARNVTEAATALTGGIVATSADADGNKFVLSTPVAKTNDLTNGGFIADVAARVFPFAIGTQIGSGAVGICTAANLVAQYHANVTETMRLARR